MSFHKNGLGTKLGGGPQRHCRVHTELARCVGGRRDHASFVALPAHDDRSALERWVVQLLHRHEERVHIDVEDDFGVGGIHGSAYRMMANDGAAVNTRKRVKVNERETQTSTFSCRGAAAALIWRTRS